MRSAPAHDAVGPVALDVNVQWSSRGVTVSPCGDIDPLTSPVLGGILSALCDGSGPDVVLDLASAAFMDAACLSVIATTAARVRAAGGSFAVRSPGRVGHRLLALTDLDHLVEPGTDERPGGARTRRQPVERARSRGADTSPSTPPRDGSHTVAPRTAVAEPRVTHERIEEPLPRALEARTVIAQAQGVIMARHGVSAETAFAAMSRTSRAAGVSVEHRAAAIVAATRRDGLIGDVMA